MCGKYGCGCSISMHVHMFGSKRLYCMDTQNMAVHGTVVESNAALAALELHIISLTALFSGWSVPFNRWGCCGEVRDASASLQPQMECYLTWVLLYSEASESFGQKL